MRALRPEQDARRPGFPILKPASAVTLQTPSPWEGAMSALWTFESAAAFWRAHHEAAAEATWDRLASAEAFLLDHTPRTSIEAETMFDVVLDQGPGGRCDGRDAKALVRLRNYISGLHQRLEAAA